MAISPTGTSDEWVFRKVINHYKLDYKDLEAAGFKFFRGSYAEQASQFKTEMSIRSSPSWPCRSGSDRGICRPFAQAHPFSPEVLQSLLKYGIESEDPSGDVSEGSQCSEDVTTAVAGSVILVNKNVPMTRLSNGKGHP